MKYSLIAVAVALIAAMTPQVTTASTVQCIAVAPVATTCQAEVYMSTTGFANFTADISNTTAPDWVSFEMALYAKNISYPGGYNMSAPVYECATFREVAGPGGCDGMLAAGSFTAVTGAQPYTFLLVATLAGSQGGIAPAWGWTWETESTGVGPVPCGGPPAAPCDYLALPY